MDKKDKKLKMNVRGTFHSLWAKLVLRRKVRKLGLSIEEETHSNIHHTEMILSGRRDRLWKAVESAKTPDIILKMDSIVFEFID